MERRAQFDRLGHFDLVLVDSSHQWILVYPGAESSLPRLACQSGANEFGQMLRLLLSEWLLSFHYVHQSFETNKGTRWESGYCAFVVRAVRSGCPLVWQRCRDLLGDGPPAWGSSFSSVRLYLDHARCPVEKFDRLVEVIALDDWTRTNLPAQDADTASPRVVQALRDKRVICWTSDSGRRFFAKGHRKVGREATVTGFLHRRCPEHFAETLALDVERGWWLSLGLPGVPYSLDEMTCDHAEHLGRTLASVQQRALDDTPRAARQPVSSHDLEAVRILMKNIALHAVFEGRAPQCAADETTWTEIASSTELLHGLPDGFIQGDFGHGNILWDGSTFRFVDNEISHWGPIVLMLSSLAMRTANVVQPQIFESLLEAYKRFWNPEVRDVLRPVTLRHLLILDVLLKLKRSLDGADRTPLGCLTEYARGRRAWPPWESVRSLIEATGHACATCVKSRDSRTAS